MPQRTSTLVSKQLIAHFDVDAFYASVEIRDNPSLRGKPVAVAGSSRRAVVLTASYEARRFGVRSAVPLYAALQSCPELVVVPPNMEKYRRVSRQIFEIFARNARLVEGLSMDEAFVDLATDRMEEAIAQARAVRREVSDAAGVTVSAGVASGKMIAKILSDSCKPDGLRWLRPGEEAAFLSPLSVGRLWGVGPKTQARLEARGIATIGDVAALSQEGARVVFGSAGMHMRNLALGMDDRRVEPQRETKSISSEETFEYDLSEDSELLAVLRTQSQELAEKLRAENLRAHTIGVKIKPSGAPVLGRQAHLDEPTAEADVIYACAALCLRRAQLRGAAVRLIGIRAASLDATAPQQQPLLDMV